MGLITVTAQQPADGDTPIEAADVNNQVNTIVTEINGALDNDNIDTSAAIAWTKMAATVMTASTPTVYKDDKTTTLAATVGLSRYFQFGKIVVGSLTLSGVGNPAGTKIYWDLPVTAKSESVNRGIGAGFAASNNVAKGGYMIIGSSDTTKGIIYLDEEATWSTSGNNGCQMFYLYEAA